MRRGLVAVLAIAALVGLPAPASADEGDPVVYFGFDDGSYYPQGYDITFGFLCVSPVSAIVSCEASQALGSKLDTFHAGVHTVSVTAIDYEGRQTTASATYTVIDITKPHAIFRTPSEGAVYDQGAQITYDYSCEDDPGGLGMFEDGCASNFPIGMPIDTTRVGTFSFSVFAVDRQFNVSEDIVHYTVLDRTPPTISLASPPEGAIYTVGQQASVSFWCHDGGTGLNACKGDLPDGSLVDTSTIGSKTFTVTASDRAGNLVRETHTYSVIYAFAGFAAPAAAYPTATSRKAGESIPLKFSLGGDHGTSIFAANSPGWAPCGALDGPARAEGSLSYNASADRYTYLAETSKSWAGSCRDLIFTLRDGTSHRARFTFGR
jgi:hypothetical protein